VLDPQCQEDLRRRLPASLPPFGDLSDLARHFYIARHCGGPSDQRRVTLVSPTWIGMDSALSSPSNRHISIRLVSYWPDLLHRASVAFIPADSLRTTQRATTLVTVSNTRSDDEDSLAHYGSAEFAWEPEYGPGTVLLNVDGEHVTSLSTGLPNRRVQLHEVFDSDLKTLQRKLNPKTLSNRSSFEQGVATLLHLCGFSIGHVGGGTAEREVDIVAFLGNRPVLLVECTTELPTLHKVQTVVARSKECLRLLHTELPYVVTAVFTPFAGELDRTHHGPVRKEGASLLGASHLQALLEMARRSESPREVLRYIHEVGFGAELS